MARSSTIRCNVQRTFCLVALILSFSFDTRYSSWVATSWARGASASVVEDWRSMSAEAYLQAVSNPGVPSFQLSDGDSVTCVKINDQTSKPTNVQFVPSSEPTPGNSTSPGLDSLKASVQTYIADSEAGGGNICPSGTIPTRNLSANYGVRAAGSVANYFRKHRHGKTSVPGLTIRDTQRDLPPVYTGFPTHEHAYASFQAPNVKGIEVFINLWSPFVERQVPEFSLAQLWLLGYDAAGNLNSMEVGWQVYELLYGDLRPRLFVYWTADSYVNTGCYNLDCPGFVQVSNKVLVGGSFNLSSTANSTQYEIKLRIFKDPETGNWWLQLNDENVGYWPESLFSLLKDSANVLEWGGEIVNIHHGTATSNHTTTEMGSGTFASAGYGHAAFQRNLQFVDSTLQLRDALNSTVATEAPGCYTSQPGYSPGGWGRYFFFGGPGYNPQTCIV